MYGDQVQGRKVAGSNKQATVGDSGMTLQNTVDDVEEHLMSLVAVPCYQHQIQRPNKKHHRNWPFWTQPPL